MSTINYGIELEYFILNSNKELVPAFEVIGAGINTDGNPVIGEIRTKPYPTIEEAVFDVKRQIFVRNHKLKQQGLSLHLYPIIEVNDAFIKKLRKNRDYLDYLGEKEYNEIYSIYGEENTKVLPHNIFKASLQLNISKNRYKNVLIGRESTDIQISELFNYRPIIEKLDIGFKEEIKNTDRVPGIYSIKDGDMGKRIEYRSLPNNADIMELIRVINE